MGLDGFCRHFSPRDGQWLILNPGTFELECVIVSHNGVKKETPTGDNGSRTRASLSPAAGVLEDSSSASPYEHKTAVPVDLVLWRIRILPPYSRYMDSAASESGRYQYSATSDRPFCFSLSGQCTFPGIKNWRSHIFG